MDTKEPEETQQQRQGKSKRHGKASGPRTKPACYNCSNQDIPQGSAPNQRETEKARTGYPRTPMDPIQPTFHSQVMEQLEASTQGKARASKEKEEKAWNGGRRLQHFFSAVGRHIKKWPWGRLELARRADRMMLECLSCKNHDTSKHNAILEAQQGRRWSILRSSNAIKSSTQP